MKSLRPLTLALLFCTGSASAALACCDTAAKSAASTTPATSATVASATKANGTTPTVPADGGCSANVMSIKTAANGSASGSMSGCSAAMSAQCTPAMRAACEKNAAVAAAMGCNMKPTSATTAATVATASTASGNNKDACAAHGAATAKGAACPMPGSTTAAGMDHCAGAKGASLTMAAAGMVCSEHMSGIAHDCSACEAWADCDQAVHAMGARTQVVSLRNGAMIVYTADTNAGVRGIQTLVAKRNDRMVMALSASTDKRLCNECKALRGAMASGKLHREVVNVERGCLTLITSDDRALVQKIRAMTGQPLAVR